MRRHSPELVDLEQLSSDTARFTRTTESYRARKRQFEKKPGSIWSVTSRSSLAIPIFLFCVSTTADELFQTALHYAQPVSVALFIVSALPHRQTAPDCVQKMRVVYRLYLAKRPRLLSYPSGAQRCAHRRSFAGARSPFSKRQTLFFILNLTAYLCSKNLTSDVVHTLLPSPPPSAFRTVTERSCR